MISITLPSLSAEAAERAIRNIDETAQHRCEIIVICPEAPVGLYHSSVLWLEDRALDGANAAHEDGFLATTGEHVLAWVDDHVLRPGWDVAALAALQTADCVGLRHVSNQLGSCFGRYYPYFPIMRRARVFEIGGWLDGDYRLGFADVDLAMRVYAAGGSCRPTPEGFVEPLPDDDRKLGRLHQEAHTTPGDLALFLARWGDTLGAGWPTARLRDFNVDVRYQS